MAKSQKARLFTFIHQTNFDDSKQYSIYHACIMSKPFMKTGKMCKLYQQSKSKSYQAQINQANHWHKFSKEIDC